MGLFGNISETINDLSNAIENLWYHPFHEESFFKGIAIGGAIFVKQGISAVSGPFVSIFQSLRSGVTFLYTNGLSG